MQIKQVAEKLHTTPRTIRYYEEKGLIQPYKLENDYRNFDEEQIDTLRTILALRELGMSTDQIRTTMKNSDNLDHYLNEQRTSLYSEWLELRDMINSLDEIIHCNRDDLFKKARLLKEVKEKRKAWKDRWHFDEQAATYNDDLKKDGHRFNVHEGYDQALDRAYQLIKAKAGETGVDIGIGTGNLGSRFLSDEAHMIGVDQSNEMLAVCKEHYPEIDSRPGHFLRLPVMDHSVDFITTSYALHHVQEVDKLLALQEMQRILKPSGRIVIADLMFEDERDKSEVINTYKKSGNSEAIQAIEDEFYADRSNLCLELKKMGFKVQMEKINHILHIIFAEKI